jgi:AbrB family looped-hinge helix DNA binding protein
VRTSTITAKGQVTIPKPIRDALNLHRGDQVIFVVEGERAFLQPVRRKRLSSLYGIARGRAPFTSRAAEREAARALAARNAVGAE